MREGNNLGSFINDIKVIEIDSPVCSYSQPPQLGSGSLGHLLPRDKVGVVFSLGHHDHIIWGEDETWVSPHRSRGDEGVCYQVERFGSVLRPHQLVFICTDKVG